MDLFDLIESDKAARDAGMRSVAQHADESRARWTDIAFDWICKYAEQNSVFISEECTSAAMAAGIPSPPDDRAWGHPFQRASRELIIKKIGYGISNRRHQSPTIKWNSLHPNFWRTS